MKNLISLIWSIQYMVLLFEFGGASNHRNLFWVHKPAVRQGCWQEKLHISAAVQSTWTVAVEKNCRQYHQISLSGSVCSWNTQQIWGVLWLSEGPRWVSVLHTTVMTQVRILFTMYYMCENTLHFSLGPRHTGIHLPGPVSCVLKPSS